MDNDMKKSMIRLICLGCLNLSLLGCATNARVYNDDKVARIQPGVTTEDQLMAWFGPASSRRSGQNGSQELGWRFPTRSIGGDSSSGNLAVSLDAGGRVTAYSASAANQQ